MPGKTFERARFNVTTAAGQREVDGWTLGAFGADRRSKGTWVVTHLGTGLYLLCVGNEAKARRAMRALNAMGPWNVTGVTVKDGCVTGTPKGVPADAAAKAEALKAELKGWTRPHPEGPTPLPPSLPKP